MVPFNYYTIRANPLLETYKVLVLLWPFVIVMFLGLLIVDILNSALYHHRFTGMASFYALLILCYIPLFVSIILQYRYWKRIERRRFAAVNGNRFLLAVEQPMAKLSALQLPCTITLRLSRQTLLFLIGVVLVFSLILSGDLAWFNNDFLFFPFDRLQDFLVIFAVMVALLVIVLGIIFLTSLRWQKVTVTEEGLSTRYGGKKSVVRWEEARLFAMYNTWGAQKSGASITYELSSAREIARWTWMLQPDRLSMGIGMGMGMRPTVPLNEYNQQMQALHAFIVARTGLPLCDLRVEATWGK